jgi:hypothetical protein
MYNLFTAAQDAEKADTAFVQYWRLKEWRWPQAINPSPALPLPVPVLPYPTNKAHYITSQAPQQWHPHQRQQQER